MVIKNKDGTIYTLRGPNPVMINQDLWQDFEIHNMNFTEEHSEDTFTNRKQSKKVNLGSTVTVQDSSPKEKIKIPKIEEYVKPPEIKVELTTPIPILPKEEHDPEVERPVRISEKLRNYKKTILCCLPADVKEYYDKLYGEKSVKYTYGQKFTFESVVVTETDMEFVFWTHLNKIQKYSIFYPKNEKKRWWQAVAIKEAPEGVFIKCAPSMNHPSF
jgi:hypothetical protein